MASKKPKKTRLVFTHITEAKKLWVSGCYHRKDLIRKRSQLNTLKAT